MQAPSDVCIELHLLEKLLHRLDHCCYHLAVVHAIRCRILPNHRRQRADLTDLARLEDWTATDSAT